MGPILVILCLFQWWRDVVRKATILGKHTLAVQRGLHIGIILFIIREQILSTISHNAYTVISILSFLNSVF